MKHTATTLLVLTTAAIAIGAVNYADRVVSTTQNSNALRGTGWLTKNLSEEDGGQVPELYPGELQDVGPQFLLGRTQPQAPRHHWLEVFTDTQFFYTNNALLTEKGNRDTGVMVQTLQANFTPQPFALGKAMVSTRFGYRHQWWLYSLDKTRSGLNDFNFSVSSFYAGIRHSWDEKWVVSFNLDLNRYLSQDNDLQQFYSEFVPNWSLERNFQVGQKGYLTVGYYGSLHLTHTAPVPTSDLNDRLDTAFSATYSQELCPGLVVQPYYRLLFSAYTKNTSRTDVYNNLGVGLIYSFNENASIRATLGYENRNSNDNTVTDYNKLEFGGGVNFSMRF